MPEMRDSTTCDAVCCKNKTLFALHGWVECDGIIAALAPRGIFPTEIRDGKLNWHSTKYVYSAEYLAKWKQYGRLLKRKGILKRSP